MFLSFKIKFAACICLFFRICPKPILLFLDFLPLVESAAPASFISY